MKIDVSWNNILDVLSVIIYAILLVLALVNHLMGDYLQAIWYLLFAVLIYLTMKD